MSSISCYMDIRPPYQAILNLDGPIPNSDSDFTGLVAGERELECGIQAAGLIRLEGVRHVSDQAGNRSYPEAACNLLHCFVLEPSARYRFRIRAGHNIDRFRPLLQRLDDLSQVSLFVVEVRTDHILAGRADRQTICRLIVGAVTQTLPQRGGLDFMNAAAVIERVRCISYLLHPIGESA